MKYSEFKDLVSRGTKYYLRRSDDHTSIYLREDDKEYSDKLLFLVYENVVGVVGIYERGLRLLTDKERLALQKLAYRYSRTPIDERHDIKYGFKLDNGSYLISNDVKTVAGNGWGAAPSAVLSEYCVSTSEQYPFESKAQAAKVSKLFKGQIVSEDDE